MGVRCSGRRRSKCSPLSAARPDRCFFCICPDVRSPKASGKWVVYSFGVLLLDLVAGRALTSLELCQCAAEEKAQALQVMEGREEAVASCLRLGAACCAMAPSKMSSIRDALQATERMPDLAAAVAASCSSSSASTTAHHHQ